MSFLGLEGKRILVTGASSGIGRAVAMELAASETRLLLVARDLARLQEAAEACPGSGHQVLSFDLVAGLEEIPGWLKGLGEKGGPIDGLVHAAGVQMAKPLKLQKPAELEHLFRLNVHAGFMLARGFRQPQVRGALGSIVFLSSVMGSVGAPGRAAYGSSKGAVEAATRSLALELAPENIRVNCVAPGFVESEMLESLSKLIGAEGTARIAALHPLGFGKPEDVAKAVAFLLGSCSRWVTGSTLTIDGGYTAQ